MMSTSTIGDTRGRGAGKSTVWDFLIQYSRRSITRTRSEYSASSKAQRWLGREWSNENESEIAETGVPACPPRENEILLPGPGTLDGGGLSEDSFAASAVSLVNQSRIQIWRADRADHKRRRISSFAFRIGATFLAQKCRQTYSRLTAS